MPSWSDILAALPTITISTAVAGLFITAGAMILVRGWPLALLALVVQYLLFGWLMTAHVPLSLALIKALMGTIACVILYWSARRIGESPGSPFASPSPDEAQRRRALQAATAFPMRMPFRAAALCLAALTTWGLALRYPLPGLTPALSLACIWLAVSALVLLAVTQAPLRIGMGLLTWLMAFEMFYVTWERSVTIAGLLGIATLLVALGAGYLTLVRGTLPPTAASEDRA